MDKKYARVYAAAYTDEINRYLAQGWEVITAAFCPVEGNTSGRRSLTYVPHALLGLPESVALEMQEKAVAAKVWSQGAPPIEERSMNETPTPQAPETASAPEPASAPSATPIASRPARALSQNVDLNTSSEEVVGIRR
jgi:hypothetical protein